jgi:hypothetical protein
VQIANWRFSDYILLVLIGMIKGIVENLTTEDSPGKIHTKQGELEGLKMLRDKIVAEFGDLNGSMLREDVPPGVDSIGKAALEHFHQQILDNSEVWKRIGEYVSACDDRAMHNLYESTEIVTRDMKRAHGRRDGLRKAHEIMDKVSETLDYARENPELPGLEEEEQGVIEFPTDGFDGIEGGEPQDEQGEEEELGPHYICLSCRQTTRHDEMQTGEDETTLLCPACMSDNVESLPKMGEEEQ